MAMEKWQNSSRMVTQWHFIGNIVDATVYVYDVCTYLSYTQVYWYKKHSTQEDSSIELNLHGW